MEKLESSNQSASAMIDGLNSLRARGRAQKHLMSVEHKRRWSALEERVAYLLLRLEPEAEGNATLPVESLREITASLRELLYEVDRTLGLAEPVRAYMESAPAACTGNHSLSHATRLMRERDCGAIPVVDGENQVIGMLTDRDVCMAAYIQGRPISALLVGSTMSRNPIVCLPDDTLGDAARAMTEKQIRRLPVVEHRKLVGIIALADVAIALREQRGKPVLSAVALAHTLAAISRPTNELLPRERSSVAWLHQGPSPK